MRNFIKKVLFSLRGIDLDGDSSLNWNVKYVRGERRVRISNSRVMCTELGEGTKFTDCTLLGDVKVGRFVSIYGPGTVISSVISSIEIGSFSSIGQNVQIQDSYHNYSRAGSYLFHKNIFDEDLKKDFISKGNVTIGYDVWVGSGSVILSGVKIGNGSIIGAGSIVNKDIGDYEIWAGNPARFVRKRFHNDTVDLLIKSRWWTWSLNKLVERKDFLITERR